MTLKSRLTVTELAICTSLKSTDPGLCFPALTVWVYLIHF